MTSDRPEYTPLLYLDSVHRVELILSSKKLLSEELVASMTFFKDKSFSLYLLSQHLIWQIISKEVLSQLDWRLQWKLDKMITVNTIKPLIVIIYSRSLLLFINA